MNTPTPWKVEIAQNNESEESIFGFRVLSDSKDVSICSLGTYESGTSVFSRKSSFPISEKLIQRRFTPQEVKANAELIVRAVNYHDRLVYELEKLSDEYKKLFTIYVKDGNPNFTFDMCDGVAKNNPNYVSCQQLLTEIEKSNAND